MARRTSSEEAAWLASVQEEVLDPDLDIVDPHHHLWDHVDPPYLLDDLLADTGSGHRVTQTVFIECGWGWRADPERPELFAVPETAAVAALAAQSAHLMAALAAESTRSAEPARSGEPGQSAQLARSADPAQRAQSAEPAESAPSAKPAPSAEPALLARRGGAVIAGIVGHADLRHGALAGAALDALAEAGGGRFVGIRHATAWDADPGIPNHRTDPVPALMSDATWRRGFDELARRDLTYDAWLYHPQIPELTALARVYPTTTMVLDHLGGPLGVKSYAGRGEEVLAACRASLSELASCPNVFLKLGGIGMPIMGGAWHRGASPATSLALAEAWGPHIRWAIEQFGADRCMFESNFPVDRASCSYVVLWNAFKRIAADASPSERTDLFAGTARRAYRLPTPA